MDIGLKKDLSDTHVQIRQSIGLLVFRSLHPKEKELNLRKSFIVSFMIRGCNLQFKVVALAFAFFEGRELGI